MKILKISICLLIAGHAFAMEDSQKELFKGFNKLKNSLPGKFRPKAKSNTEEKNEIKQPKPKKAKIEELVIPKNCIDQLSNFQHNPEASSFESLKEQFLGLISNAKDEKDVQLILFLLQRQSIRRLIFNNPETLFKPLCQLIEEIASPENKEKQIKYSVLSIIIKTLFNCNKDFKLEDYKDNNLLIKMVKNNIDSNYIQMCLDLGLNINAQDDTGLASLHYTAKLGNLDTLKLLIKLHADHNILSKNGNDLLGIAALNGQKEIIEYLINELKFDVNFINPNQGTTACFRAIQNGHLETLKLLINLGADYNLIDKFGDNLLFYAAQYDKKEIIAYLVNELKLDVNFKNPVNGITACFRAVQNGHLETLKLLIKLDADYNVIEKFGDNLLLHAALNGQKEIITYLVNELKFDFNFINPNQGTTACFRAIQNGHLETLKLLINLGANYNLITKDGTNLLLHAACNGEKEIITYLVNELKFDVNFKNHNQDTTACFRAIQNGDLEALKLLINLGANYNLIDKFGDNLLLDAAYNGQKEIITYLVNELKFDVNFKNPNKDTTACFRAIQNGHLETLKLLIKLGANYNLITKIGDNLLFYAAQYDKKEIIAYLINELKFDINFKNPNQGTMACFRAVEDGHLEALKFLVSLGADYKLISNSGANLLTHAAYNGQKEIITYLVNELKFDVNFIKPNKGTTACFGAVENGYLEALKLLIKLGADYTIIAKSGINLLLNAAQHDQKEIIAFLVNELKFDINFKDTVDGWTACYSAAKSGKAAALLKLIEMGANIKAMTKKNESPLKISKQNKHLEIVKIIENKILSDLDQDWTCPICANSKGESTDKPLIVLDCCCQVICNDCFVPTVANQNKCPMCKAPQNFN